MKKILILMMIAILSVSVVIAAEPGEVSVTGSSILGEYVASDGGNLAIQSGDVYDANLTSSVSTFVWSAITGTVSGDIVLGTGTAADEWLYNWGADGYVVYASTAATPDWSTVVAAVVGDMPAFITTGAADDWDQTFVLGAETLTSAIYPALAAPSVLTYSDNQTGTTDWYTFSLISGANLIWAGEVQMGGTLFDQSTGDYQIIVPENGLANDVATTTYYLWAELI